MKRVDILKKLANCGVIAVVRGDSAQQAIKASEAIVAGGWPAPAIERMGNKLLNPWLSINAR